MNCRYCHAPLPEDSRESKQFCSASHKVMFSRKGALPVLQSTEAVNFPAPKITDLSKHPLNRPKPMPAIPKKILKRPAVKPSSVQHSIHVGEDHIVDLAPCAHAPIRVLKKIVSSKPKFTGPRQWPIDITLGEVKNRLKGIRNYLEWATEQGLRGQVATRSWVEGLLAQAGQPASLADLVFGPKQKEDEVDDIP
jgi:hypothetical protein